jgi:hypothetical protein
VSRCISRRPGDTGRWRNSRCVAGCARGCATGLTNRHQHIVYPPPCRGDRAVVSLAEAELERLSHIWQQVYTRLHERRVASAYLPPRRSACQGVAEGGGYGAVVASTGDVGPGVLPGSAIVCRGLKHSAIEVASAAPLEGIAMPEDEVS